MTYRYTGFNYDRNLTVKEIAVKIGEYLKANKLTKKGKAYFGTLEIEPEAEITIQIP